MALGGAALVCFLHRALAGLLSPLLEINYHFRFCDSVALLENKRPDCGQYMAELMISVSLLTSSKQSSALAMRPPPPPTPFNLV